MKDSRRSTLLAIVLLLTASLPAQADAVDDFIRAEMSRRHIPGLSLAIVKDGRLIKSQGYGLANVELKVPATPDGV
jgi:CubicO group peptidase (beta-lactamase class C family)